MMGEVLRYLTLKPAGGEVNLTVSQILARSIFAEYTLHALFETRIQITPLDPS